MVDRELLVLQGEAGGAGGVQVVNEDRGWQRMFGAEIGLWQDFRYDRQANDRFESRAE